MHRAARCTARESDWWSRRSSASRRDPRSLGAIPDRILVRLCPHGLGYTWGSAPHARLRRLFAAELGIGKHADRGVGLFLDLCLARWLAAEATVGKSAAALDELEELRLGGAADRVLFAPLAGGSEQRRLDLVERFRDGGRYFVKRYRRLPAGPAGKNDLATREVARPDLQSHGYTEAFPLEVLGSGFHRVTEIELDPDAELFQVGFHLTPNSRHLTSLVISLPDRHNHDRHGGELRWRNEPIVVRMRHDQAADEPSRDAPGRTPHVFEATGCGLILHVERLGEILAEVVRCPRLDRLIVLHQRFDRVRAQRPGELFTVGFQTGEDGHRQPLFVEASVNLQDQTRLTLGVRFIDVRGVSFLPEELRRPQER